jgi:hypothetical protein
MWVVEYGKSKNELDCAIRSVGFVHIYTSGRDSLDLVSTSPEMDAHTKRLTASQRGQSLSLSDPRKCWIEDHESAVDKALWRVPNELEFREIGLVR